MLHLKRALDDKGHVLLEMPTGTGKTVCLISLITSYQFQHKQTGKLIYCTRTVPEMSKCMEEIKKVIEYRTKCIGAEGGKVLALCLSSRRNMCVHPTVIEEGDRDTVDTLCRRMTASWVRNRIHNNRKAEHISLGAAVPSTQGVDDEEIDSGAHSLCEFYENYFTQGSQAEIPMGIYSLDDLREFGTKKGWCPYFMARHLIHHASVLVYNYQYMLDPKVANIVSKELEAESIVVFDEAHNIDNVCIEALSVTLDQRLLTQAARSAASLTTKVNKLKVADTERLQKEYSDLVRGLQQQQAVAGASSSSNATAAASAAPISNAAQLALQQTADALPLGAAVLSQDLLEEAVPGSLRRAEHFTAFLKKIVVHLKQILTTTQAVENKTPLAFLHSLQEATGLERKALKYCYLRLSLLLRTLQITGLDEYSAITEVANFITLVASYMEGFAVITEPQGGAIRGVAEPLLHLVCLDAAIAAKPVLTRFASVVITSGTLSPIDLYPRLLGFTPVAAVSLPMSIFRPCLLPLIVTRGSDQLPLSTRFELRQDTAVLRNYGQLLVEVCRIVPDGVCGFFTSYQFMETVVQQWDSWGILTQLMEHKLVFLETKDVVETTFALENYRRACDSGRGAVFLSVARGKVAEGIDFDRHYGRCVLLFGVPYQYTLSHTLRARLQFLRDTHNINDSDFLTFDALRQAAQCVGRVIRSKTDYGIVLMADARYARKDKRSRLPLWVQQFIREQGINLSTDVAAEQMKLFLRQMGQPIEQAALRSILLSEQDVLKLGRQDYLIPVAAVAGAELLVKQPQELDLISDSRMQGIEDIVDNIGIDQGPEPDDTAMDVDEATEVANEGKVGAKENDQSYYHLIMRYKQLREQQPSLVLDRLTGGGDPPSLELFMDL